MIETKEQYEGWRNALLDDDLFGSVNDQHMVETFEALREVARAAKPATVRLQMLQAAGPIGKSPKWTQDLADALDAIPDWITDG